MGRGKNLIVLLILSMFLGACGGSEAADEEEQTTGATTAGDATSQLVANFDVVFELENTGDTVCPVLSTSFTDTSEGSPERWLWEFPDGSTSNEQNPTVDEEIRGTVFLTVWIGDDSSFMRQDVRNGTFC